MRAGPTRKAPNRMPAAISSAQSELPMRRATIRRSGSSRSRQGFLRGVPLERGGGAGALVRAGRGERERRDELVRVLLVRGPVAERDARAHRGQRVVELADVVGRVGAATDLVGAAV